jgi:hypothetical protein
MKLKVSILFFFIICLSLSAQSLIFDENTPIPRSYTVYKTSLKINIDGQGNETDWQAAPWSDPFVDIEGVKTPSYNTQMKMLWDTENLYVYAKLEEPHIWGTLKQRDTVIFYNNDFEIFIDPDGDTHNYIEFEMNVLNTLWDLFLTAPYRNDPKVLDHWDMKGVQSAVSVKGSLNDPTDIDEYWSLELAIPWNVLKEASAASLPPIGQFWRMGFSRVNWDFDLQDNRYSRKKEAGGNYLPEHNWVWSAQGVINMHEPEKWGYVFFSPNTPLQNTSALTDPFSIPQEEYLKWFMYQEYRKLLGVFKEGKSLSLKRPQVEIHHKSIRLELSEHKEGYTLTAKSPFSNKTLQINTTGKFTSYETNTH